MKLTTGVVALAVLAGSAWGQNPGIIQKTKDALFGANKQQTAASNAALQGTAQPKPSGAVAGKPATTAAPQAVPAVKPVAAKVAPATAAAPQTAAKTAQPTVKPAVQSAAKPAPSQPTVKPVVAPVKTQPAAKPVVTPAKSQPAPKAPVAVKQAAAPKASAPKVSPMAPKVAAKPAPAATEAKAKDEGEPKAEKQEDKKYSMTGKRDPFVSPVVNRTMSSGCSTGKKCLDIEQIALHGVVKSDNGMIAVVTNGLNKAYFLRENDPVFNGYVVKITGDSIVFKQNFQDRLGKPFTKDVVKRITTPAV